MILRILSGIYFFIFTCSLIFAEQQNEKATKPLIEKIDEENYKIGKVSFNKKTKEIFFLAKINEIGDILEYLVVNDFGKTHEALFITDIKASNLNVALKLLGYKESQELFYMYDEDMRPLDKLHDVPEDVKKAARLDIYASWKGEDGKKNVHVNQLIKNDNTGEHAKIKPYIYNGSYLLDGNFKADLSGDIIAIFTNPGSIANFSNEGNDDDTIWLAMTKQLPKKETVVTLTFKKHNAPK